MTEWQPIETAPKDGTPIILYGSQKVSSYIKKENKQGFWGSKITEPFVFQGYFLAGLWQIDGFGVANPTHWMPLPTPPEQEGE